MSEADFNENKQHKINTLIQKYENQLQIFKQMVSRSIQKIQSQHIPIYAKRTLVNKLIQNANNIINLNKQQMQNAINKIQNTVYIPMLLQAETITLQISEQPQPIKKNAVLIGINYMGSQNELKGCVNDVNSLNSFIKNKAYNNIEILTDFTPVTPTRDNILHAFQNLLETAKPNDVLFFSYSGHGSYVKDMNNNEVTGNDQLIVTSDFKPIVDDELKSIIQKYLKTDVTLFALFDCCFSGTVLDLKYNYADSLFNNANIVNTKENETIGNVIMISGCTDLQTSADAYLDNKAQGAMTWAFLKSFRENMSWKELLITMREHLKISQFTQIPQLSSGKFINVDDKIYF